MTSHFTGVAHVLGQEKELFENLKGKKRVGVEEIHDPAGYDSRRSDSAYWKAVHDFAGRNRIKLFPLAKPFRENPLKIFNSALGSWINHHVLTDRLSWEDSVLPTIEVNYKSNRFSKETRRKAVELARAVSAHYPSPRFDQAQKIFDALAVLQSVQMHEAGKSLDLDDSVVGSTHAEHIRLIFNADVTHLNPVPPGSQQSIASYKELQPLMQSIRRISS